MKQELNENIRAAAGALAKLSHLQGGNVAFGYTQRNMWDMRAVFLPEDYEQRENHTVFGTSARQFSAEYTNPDLQLNEAVGSLAFIQGARDGDSNGFARPERAVSVLDIGAALEKFSEAIEKDALRYTRRFI